MLVEMLLEHFTQYFVVRSTKKNLSSTAKPAAGATTVTGRHWSQSPPLTGAGQTGARARR